MDRRKDIRAECCINKEHIHSQIPIGRLKKYLSALGQQMHKQFSSQHFSAKPFVKLQERFSQKPLETIVDSPAKNVEESGVALHIHPADMFSTRRTNPQWEDVKEGLAKTAL